MSKTTINKAMSVYHLKLLCITFISLAPLFENHRPKEGKGILMKVFSLTYFPEEKGKEWKDRESERRERVDTRGRRRGGKGKMILLSPSKFLYLTLQYPISKGHSLNLEKNHYEPVIMEFD